MPKKTKQEKIRAQQRRTVHSSYVSHSSNISAHILPIAHHPSPVIQPENDDYVYSKRDILKTVLLTLGILTIEFLISIRLN